MAVGVAVLAHVDDADVGVGGVGRHPVGLDELFGMRVRHGQDRQDGKHEQSLAHAAPFPLTVGGVNDTTLSGVSVLVAGAGLAGLSAARDLIARGATVTVIDVRDRVGGRVWTIRDGFAEGQHAEAGGDMIDEEQHEIRELAAEVGLKLTRILKGGFGYVRADQAGRAEDRRAQRDSAAGSGWPASCAGSAGPTTSPSGGGTRRSPPTSRGAPSRPGSIR